jgi:hypothetical protein
MIDSGDVEKAIHNAMEQPELSGEEGAGTSLQDRLKRILFWAIGIGIVVAILGTFKGWGDQQQRATLRGRSWPPEPVKVFFGR